MRELIINCIKHEGWLDYDWRESVCGKNLHKQYPKYEDYLKTLDDEDLLFTYDRIREAESNLD